MNEKLPGSSVELTSLETASKGKKGDKVSETLWPPYKLHLCEWSAIQGALVFFVEGLFRSL